MAIDDTTKYSQSIVEARYSRSIVEGRMLIVAGERNPSHLTEDELIGEIVVDRGDEAEVDTARQAIAGLREFDLVAPREDGIVELTPTGLRAVALLRPEGGHG